jgi:hypothetical protein
MQPAVDLDQLPRLVDLLPCAVAAPARAHTVYAVLQLAKILLAHGADPNATDKVNKKARDVSACLHRCHLIP